MSRLRCHMAVSLDGFAAGPDQSVDEPLGAGGMQLHEWLFQLASWREPHGEGGGEAGPSDAVIARTLENIGATIMGRNMFGGGPGPWGTEPSWDGWWGEDPPFHHPVFVLTHHPRAPLTMEGGTTFTFVTDGIAAALDRARAAAGGRDVNLGGGADVVRQYLRAGLIDELLIHLVPVLLGAGERLLDGLDGAGVRLELTDVVTASGVTHLTHRVVR